MCTFLFFQAISATDIDCLASQEWGSYFSDDKINTLSSEILQHKADIVVPLLDYLAGEWHLLKWLFNSSVDFLNIQHLNKHASYCRIINIFTEIFKVQIYQYCKPINVSCPSIKLTINFGLFHFFAINGCQLNFLYTCIVGKKAI